MSNAQKAIQNKRFQEALNIYTYEISEHPENLDAYFKAARCLIMLKRPSEAINMAEKMIILEANSATAHVIKAEAYQQMKDVNKSKNEIEIAYSIDPANITVLLSYGHLSLKFGNLEKGISYFEKALEQDSTIYIYFALAFSYLKKGDTEKNLYYTKKVYELKPSLKNRVRLIYAQLNRIRLLKLLIYSILLVFIVSAVLGNFLSFSISGLIILVLIYFRIIFETP
jgi:tetratricopeptide (TPR) repeat protein